MTGFRTVWIDDPADGGSEPGAYANAFRFPPFADTVPGVALRVVADRRTPRLSDVPTIVSGGAGCFVSPFHDGLNSRKGQRNHG